MLDGVALVLNLCTLGYQTLTSLLPTATDDLTTISGLHPGAEAVLVLAASLRWLVGAFHISGLKCEDYENFRSL